MRAYGLVSQSVSVDPEMFSGVWALSGTYGAFTPLRDPRYRGTPLGF
jgi:hypothetical protein